MAKVTKSAGASPASTSAAAPVAPQSAPASQTSAAIDISKLTPEQLAQLQKQLKATKKASNANSEERFKIIETMLAEKDEAGQFKHTTRDILNVLQKEKLVVTNCADDEQEEIKKIQARKQFLEKKRDEKGELVHEPGTFGYKPSSFLGFKMTPQKIADWFTAENVKTLSAAQVDRITNALNA